MKKLAFIFLVWSASGPVLAGKTYQVTGPVLDVTDTMIVVQKGKEKWEIARDGNTKVTGDLQKGAKVTVEYTMAATSVEVKAAKK
jgi:RNase P/RNase MRP subunit p29